MGGPYIGFEYVELLEYMLPWTGEPGGAIPYCGAGAYIWGAGGGGGAVT